MPKPRKHRDIVTDPDGLDSAGFGTEREFWDYFDTELARKDDALLDLIETADPNTDN